jgi:hypothetical protein
VHRGCISQLCGVRQIRVAAQELESTTQEKDLRVVEYLGGKAVYEIHNIRQKLYCEFCEELCQVGIEHMHRGALGKTWL